MHAGDPPSSQCFLEHTDGEDGGEGEREEIDGESKTWSVCKKVSGNFKKRNSVTRHRCACTCMSGD